MVKVKNKDWMYVIVRHDFDGKDIVIATTASSFRADELLGEYQQDFLDHGISEDESYFYITTTTFYE